MREVEKSRRLRSEVERLSNLERARDNEEEDSRCISDLEGKIA